MRFTNNVKKTIQNIGRIHCPSEYIYKIDQASISSFQSERRVCLQNLNQSYFAKNHSLKLSIVTKPIGFLIFSRAGDYTGQFQNTCSHL